MSFKGLTQRRRLIIFGIFPLVVVTAVGAVFYKVKNSPDNKITVSSEEVARLEMLGMNPILHNALREFQIGYLTLKKDYQSDQERSVFINELESTYRAQFGKSADRFKFSNWSYERALLQYLMLKDKGLLRTQTNYSRIFRTYHPYIELLIKHDDFDDLYLIGPDKRVVYEAKEGIDLGSMLGSDLDVSDDLTSFVGQLFSRNNLNEKFQGDLSGVTVIENGTVLGAVVVRTHLSKQMAFAKGEIFSGSWRSAMVMMLFLIGLLVSAVIAFVRWFHHVQMKFDELAQSKQMCGEEIEELKNQLGRSRDESSNHRSMIAKVKESANEIAEMSPRQLGWFDQSRSYFGQMRNQLIQGESLSQRALHETERVHSLYLETQAAIAERFKKFQDMSSSMSRLDEKTSIIHEIVFQTKLLSFNASVEASRAGEFGRGFSVVAKEIGNLAELSGQAFKDISDLINSNAEDVRKLVQESSQIVEQVMVRGMEPIKGSRQALQNANDSLRSMGEVFTRLTDSVDRASQGAQNQAALVDQFESLLEGFEFIGSNTEGQIVPFPKLTRPPTRRFKGELKEISTQ